MERFDVAIVGYGPTGATLAHLLGACGLKTLVLEREVAAYHLPRAVHFDGEVMRVFQWAGIAADLEPLTHTHPGMRFVAPDGKLLLDWPRPQGEGPQGWRANYRFHQLDLETLLRETMAARPTVTVRSRCNVIEVDDAGDAVDLRYELGALATLELVYAPARDTDDDRYAARIEATHQPPDRAALAGRVHALKDHDHGAGRLIA